MASVSLPAAASAAASRRLMQVAGGVRGSASSTARLSQYGGRTRTAADAKSVAMLPPSSSNYDGRKKSGSGIELGLGNANALAVRINVADRCVMVCWFTSYDIDLHSTSTCQSSSI